MHKTDIIEKYNIPNTNSIIFIREEENERATFSEEKFFYVEQDDKGNKLKEYIVTERTDHKGTTSSIERKAVRENI